MKSCGAIRGKRIETALESFAKGESQVEEFSEARLSLVTLAPQVFGPNGFNPERDAVPFTAISRHAKGHLFLIATPLNGDWAYRVDYPYYSWAETVVRPPIVRRDLSGLMTELNDLEQSPAGKWRIDSSELASAAKFIDESGRLATSRLTPDTIASRLRSHLRESMPATAP